MFLLLVIVCSLLYSRWVWLVSVLWKLGVCIIFSIVRLVVIVIGFLFSVLV